MSFPTPIPLQSWFYPTGNTPAVNLLRDGPAWNSAHAGNTTNLLLLACGDPRNILFSLWNLGEHGEFALELSATYVINNIGWVIVPRSHPFAIGGSAANFSLLPSWNHVANAS